MKKYLILFVFLSIKGFSQLKTIPETALSKAGSEFRCVAINPDNRIVAAGDQQGKIYLWDAVSKSLINTFEGHKEIVIALAFSHDGNFLASAGRDNTIIIWSTRQGVKVKTLDRHKGTITSIAFSPDSHLLASGSIDKKVLVWDFIEGKVIHTIGDSQKEITSVAFTHDGKILAAGGYEGSVTCWNTSNWAEVKKLNVDIGKVRAINFSHDDKLIAISREKKGVQLIDMYSSYVVATLKEHKDMVNDMEFSADGKYLFTGSLDNTVKIHDLESKKLVGSLGPYYYFSSINGSVDGQQLAVVDLSEKVHLYDLKELAIKGRSRIAPTQYVSLTEDIRITLLEPNTPFDSVFIPQSNRLTIKGTVTSKNGVASLTINNQEIKVAENGFFQHETTVALGRWNIPFVARDFNNNILSKTLVTERTANASEDSHFRNGKDYALIIASDQYDELQHLNNPIFDGTAIKKDLEEYYGFETKVLPNPTKAQIQKEIRNYTERSYARGDQLFIFFAGHGEFDKVYKMGYIAARDSKKEDDVKDSYLSYANLREYVNNIPCEHILLVLDVCYGGTFNPAVASRGQEDFTDMDRQRFIMSKIKYRTRKYITSGGNTYVSDGIKGNHSPFARKFIEALRSRGGADGILTFSEIVSYVEKVDPGPTYNEFGTNEPGSDFMFITDEKKK